MFIYTTHNQSYSLSSSLPPPSRNGVAATACFPLLSRRPFTSSSPSESSSSSYSSSLPVATAFPFPFPLPLFATPLLFPLALPLDVPDVVLLPEAADPNPRPEGLTAGTCEDEDDTLIRPVPCCCSLPPSNVAR